MRLLRLLLISSSSLLSSLSSPLPFLCSSLLGYHPSLRSAALLTLLLSFELNRTLLLLFPFLPSLTCSLSSFFSSCSVACFCCYPISCYCSCSSALPAASLISVFLCCPLPSCSLFSAIKLFPSVSHLSQDRLKAMPRHGKIPKQESDSTLIHTATASRSDGRQGCCLLCFASAAAVCQILVLSLLYLQ
jgi:hypothetical protein